MNSTRPSRTRRLAALLAVGMAGATLVAAPAHADPTTLTIVGTSDVYDSNLIQSVIKPGFEAAYPAYTLNYISKGTGAAIDYAEAGNADGMIVHAATLENQFVYHHYSLEKYGRAVFWGDYIFAGANSDPAAVGTTSPHDIVGAFDDVAKAGALQNADFVSRGGTPGTTVQEHQIWALVAQQDPSVTTCRVSQANGGGAVPSTTGGDCPTTGSPSYPSWYHSTGFTQGPNITAANACTGSLNTSTAQSNDCYVFTDRGTFNYLQSTNSVPNLSIITRKDPNAVGANDNLLVNAFHAYALDPSAVPSGTVLHTQGAVDFLDYLTSPAAQTAIGNYLSGSNDPPFKPAATPELKVDSKLPPRTTGAQAITMSGSIANRIPGYPALSNVKVALVSTAPGQSVGVPVVTTTTSSGGGFTLRYVPRRSARYAVTVPGFSKIEFTYPSPVPPFGDLLTETSQDEGSSTLVGSVYRNKITRRGHQVTLGVHVAPAPIQRNAVVQVLRAHPGGQLRQFAQRSMPLNRSNDAWSFPFPSGQWSYQLRYVEPGALTHGMSKVYSVRVP